MQQFAHASFKRFEERKYAPRQAQAGIDPAFILHLRSEAALRDRGRVIRVRRQAEN